MLLVRNGSSITTGFPIMCPWWLELSPGFAVSRNMLNKKHEFLSIICPSKYFLAIPTCSSKHIALMLSTGYNCGRAG